MPDMQAGDVRFFEIRSDSIGAAAYSYHVPQPANGADPRDVIRNVALAGRLPAGGDTPMRPAGNSDRYLDIVEARAGLCTYAFRLNFELLNVQRLQFVEDRPFIPLPLGTGEVFLSDFQMGYDATGLWASFACDTDAVRRSELVRRLGGHAFNAPEHDHPEILTIPFTFNFIDPVLGVSPWAVPREAHAQGANFHFFTHGGVHPSPMSFLILEL